MESSLDIEKHLMMEDQNVVELVLVIADLMD